MPIRICLTHNTGAKRPTTVATGHLRTVSFAALQDFCRSKLKIKGKKNRLFVCKGSAVVAPGTEITNDTQDLESILTDGVLIAVATKGDDFKSADAGATGQTVDAHMKLSATLARPPRYPFPGKPVGKAAADQNCAVLSIEQGLEEVVGSVDSHEGSTPIVHPTDLPPSTATEMHGVFPVLRGNVLGLVDDIVSSDPAIVRTVRDDEDWVVFDYRGEVPAFLNPDAAASQRERFERAVHRECRGLILSRTTGVVIARRFQKFFNLHEREEAVLDCMDLSHAQCSEKLDGQLCSPVPLRNGGFAWATRTTRSDAIETFVATRPEYTRLATWAQRNGCTPLLEWCPDSHVVGVLRHAASSLTLLALRRIDTGEYIGLDAVGIEAPELLEVPIAASLGPYADLNIEGWVDREGVVLTLPDGRMFKAKCPWYVAMASASKLGGSSGFLPELLKAQPLQAVPVDRVWLTAVENLDDVISACTAALISRSEAEGRLFLEFVGKVRELQNMLAADLSQWAADAFSAVSDASAVATFAYQMSGWPPELTRAALRGKTDLQPHLKRYLCDLARSGRLPELEALLGISWSAGGIGGDENEVFQSCPEYDNYAADDVKEHVLTVYLPRKISQIMGKSHSRTLLIPRNYAGDEGKIVGLFETFAKIGVHDLRVDLQPGRKDGPNEHYGSAEYALLLVQYGIAGSPHRAGNLAGVLVPTDCELATSHVVSGMEASFKARRPVKLSRRPVNKHCHVYCDLDGVLADFERGVRDLTGRATSNQPVTKMWQRILNRGGFFRNLPWLPYGEALWAEITSLSPETPTILTGLPFNAKKQVHREKQAWCKEQLGTHVPVICCNSRDKSDHAQAGSILIDDNIDRKKDWELYGGTFIHHVRPERTTYELARALGKLERTEVPVPTVSGAKNSVRATTIVTDSWPMLETDKLVSIDCEWSESSGALSLVQLGVSRGVFIIDMQVATSVVKERLHEFLLDESVVKVGFSLTQDVQHLGCNMVNTCCLQEVAVDQLQITGLRGRLPSLADFAKTVLGIDMQKEKSLQNGDWTTRPLPENMVEYAAEDAAVVLSVYNYLRDHGVKMPTSDLLSMRSKGGQIKANPDFDPSIPVTCAFSAVFLSPASRAALLAAFPPRFKQVWADHVTIAYNPSEPDLRGLPVGAACEVTVIGPPAERSDTRAEALYVSDLEIPGTDQGARLYTTIARPHVTLSTAVNVAAGEALQIDFSACSEKSIKLHGIVGLVVAEQEANVLAALPEKIRVKIETFAREAQPKEDLKFHPRELSAADRRLVHAFAEENGMDSRSEGKDNERRLTLVMRRRRGVAEAGAADLRVVSHAGDDDRERLNYGEKAAKTRRITDHTRFAELNFIRECAQRNYVGVVQDGGQIEWNQSADIVHSARVLILRGTPGSGKSGVARNLAGLSGVVCSADDFFSELALKKQREGNEEASYESCFSTDLLKEAHDWCHHRFLQALTGGAEKVIVDNTNTTLKEYRKYVEAANDVGCRVAVIELDTPSKAAALRYGARSLHRVPAQALLRMLSRWERDDQALMVRPFDKDETPHQSSVRAQGDTPSQSLRSWLSSHHFLHFNKRRRRTHIEFALGHRPLSFIDIPEHLTSEFYQRFAFTDNQEEPKYFAEVIGPRFRFFLDVDAVLPSTMDRSEIVEIAQAVHSECLGGTGRVLVTGNLEGHLVGESGIKIGLHIKTPDLVVDAQEAALLREKLVAVLSRRLPERDWSTILDSAIYTTGQNLRMLGSRKVTRGVDVGRVYYAVLLLEHDGQISESLPTGSELLKLASIHPLVSR